MTSRPELIQMCLELGIDCRRKTIDEMKVLIRKGADKKFNKKYCVSGNKISIALRKFLAKEYDYKFYNKGGVEVRYDGKKKEEKWNKMNDLEMEYKIVECALIWYRSQGFTGKEELWNAIAKFDDYLNKEIKFAVKEVKCN